MLRAVVITIVNDRAGHTAEYRLDDIEELRLSGQWQYLDSWRVIMGCPAVQEFDSIEKLFRRVPRRSQYSDRHLAEGVARRKGMR